MARHYARLCVLIVLGVAALVCLVVYAAFRAGFGQVGDLFSLGQLVLGVILLPATLVTLWQTLDELRRSQEFPDLDLYWLTKSGERSKESVCGIDIGESQTMRLMLLNRGPVICIWFVLRFKIPAHVAAKSWHQMAWKPNVGTMPGNWTISFEDGAQIYTFMSNGKVAAYPDYPLVLADVPVALYTDRNCPAAWLVPYEIATDRGKPKTGSLTLRFARKSE